jgi:hypothetical protein
MNFPLENPVLQFFYWLVDTPGLGGLTVILFSGASVALYALVLRWVHRGALAEEVETYSYPTPALHGGDH